MMGMTQAERNAKTRARGKAEAEKDESRWLDAGCPEEFTSVIVDWSKQLHPALTDSGHWVYTLTNLTGQPLAYAGQTGAGAGCESLRQRMYDHRKLETVGPGAFRVKAVRHRLEDLITEEGKAILYITQLYCDGQSWFRPTNGDPITTKLLARHDARHRYTVCAECGQIGSEYHGLAHYGIAMDRATPLDRRNPLPQIEMFDQ